MRDRKARRGPGQDYGQDYGKGFGGPATEIDG